MMLQEGVGVSSPATDPHMNNARVCDHMRGSVSVMRGGVLVL